jgi:hypothetical protein
MSPLEWGGVGVLVIGAVAMYVWSEREIPDLLYSAGLFAVVVGMIVADLIGISWATGLIWAGLMVAVAALLTKIEQGGFLRVNP